MRLRTQRRLGAALVVVMVGLLGIMAAIFVQIPAGTAPARYKPAPAGATQDGRTAAAFCALVLTQPALEPSLGAAYALSGETSYPLLRSLAAEWGRTGEPGAREQVAMQCRREGFRS